MLENVLVASGAVCVTLYCVRKAIEVFVWKSCRNRVRLEGKIVVVTGADSGIGYETTKELLKRDAFVVLACRNVQKAEAAIAKLEKEIGPSHKYMICELDLTSFTSINKFARRIRSELKKVDILINNAGVSYPKNEYRTTKAGVEIHFATNYLGHFYLTNALMANHLFSGSGSSEPVRIVTLCSKLYERGMLNFENWFRGSATTGNCSHLYADSKLALVHFNREFSDRYRKRNIETYAVCPGFTYTNLFRHQSLPLWKIVLALPIMFLFLRSPKLGAQTSIFCATDPSLVGKSGQIYRNCSIFNNKKPIDPKDSTHLWSYTSDIIQKISPQ